MERQKKIDLEYDDVIRFEGYTYTVRQVLEALHELLADKGDLGKEVRKYFRNLCVPMAYYRRSYSDTLFNEPECEGLQQSGGGWKEGTLKMKFTIEYSCDEEESDPLDDIRRSWSDKGM